jgi:hypothetical protein
MNRSVSNHAAGAAARANYAVMLPCSDEEFAGFISSLLGKPQTIEKVMGGIFEVDERSITNLYHLVAQRIAQQNEAQLIQFTVTIVYDDDSTHLLNSLEDFQGYTEVKPLVSVAVHLSWSYLVRFHSKQALEKQTIEMSIIAGNSGVAQSRTEDGILVLTRRKWMPSSSIFLRISHTERTWGVDMESLLTGHIRTLIRKPDPLRAFIAARSDDIGLIFAILFFLSALAGVFFAGTKLVSHYVIAAKDFASKFGAKVGDPEKMLRKIDFLTDIIVTGVWPRFVFNSAAFLCVALLVSIVFGVVVSEKAANRPPSFVLLSAEAKNHRERILKRGKAKWREFIYSMLIGVATGIIGNILFAHFFSSN